MKKFKREVLWQAKEFGKYQPDFLRALLHKEEYTLAEARRILKNFYDEKEDA